MIIVTISNKTQQSITFYVDKIGLLSASAYATVAPSFSGHMVVQPSKSVTIEETRLNLGQIANLQKKGSISVNRRTTNEHLAPSLSPSPSFFSPSPSASAHSPSISAFSPSASVLSASPSASAHSPSISTFSPSISVFSPSISAHSPSPSPSISASPSPSI